MPSYIPEHSYRFTGWDERNQPTYGLVPWPEHLKPRAPERDVHLTNKRETYLQAALAEAGGVFFLTLDPKDRVSIATTIERLIGLLDAMDGDPDLEAYLAGSHGGERYDDREGDESLYGDCDLEPSLGWAASGQHGQNANFASNWGDLEKDDADDERNLGWEKGSMPYDQTHLAMYGTDEAEDVSEDEGACIQTQLHDACDEGNDEPFLGRLETIQQGSGTYMGGEFPAESVPAYFDGDGGVAARRVLQNLRTARPDVRQEYVRSTACFGNYDALRVDALTIRSNKGRERLGADELTILRPGIAMVGGYRDTAVMRAIQPRDDGLTPEIDLLAHFRAAHG